MRRTIGLVATIGAFAAIPGVAHATKFSGTCDPIEGTATFKPPLTSTTNEHGEYDFAGTATCTGKVDGKSVSGPAHVAVKGTGNISCSSGESDSDGKGTITLDSTGQTVPFLMTFTAHASEVDIVLKGTKSGEGTGHASFADMENPQNNLTTLQNCGPGGAGNEKLTFTANATVPEETPLDDGVEASSTPTTSTGPNEGGPSTGNEPTNTGSSTTTAPAGDTKAKSKKKSKKSKKKCGKTKPKNRGKKHPKSSCGKAKGHAKSKAKKS